MILLFLTSGLLLGWSLGANDASNIFGSAVGSRMVTFRKAAVIASISVILGAVLQGTGTSDTLGKLGSVNAVAGSFTVALAAAICVYLMTKFALPVSTTQAIVGAIIGWNLFTGNPTDTLILTEIVGTWISGPIIGAFLAVIFYILLMKFKRKARIHLVIFESYIKTALIIVGAFGAYSLGANNIANVMGVFIPSFHFNDLDLGIFTLNSNQQLFLLGGLAIATGIITYSRRVMETVGINIIELSSEAALVVVFAHSVVLFIFSSSSLSNFLSTIGLPHIPMVPVSSSQVIVGCVMGIGLYKGAGKINFKIIGQIAAGWIATPVASGLLSFFSLFFMKNIFNLNVGSPSDMTFVPIADSISGHDASSVIKYVLLGILIFGVIGIVYYLLLERQKRRTLERSEEKFWKNIN